jgi:serine phosphatase RsbU (regulator of sigma subunit)
MSTITLKKLFGKKTGLSAMLAGMLAMLDEPVGILDTDGRLLLGSDPGERWQACQPAPVLLERQVVGWVASNEPSLWQSNIAYLLGYLCSQEAEKKALTAEVLDKYRELNLLYRLSDRLVTSPQAQTIANMALDEACPLIQVNGGIVVLKREKKGGIEIIASCGYQWELKTDALVSKGVISHVLQTGIAELANQIDPQIYFVDLPDTTISLLCAPLKTEQTVFGALIMVGHGDKQFTAGDLKLLNAVAMQTAPAIEIADLHQFEIEKVRLERDLHSAYQVQSGLLPRKMPAVEGWQVAAFWQPARIVSGDFYDFIKFPDGSLGLAIADVADKGMPAALVMANTRSVLHAVAVSAGRQRRESPGKILARANNLLCEDMPMNMFTTCLLVILDPKSGQVSYANAGHNLPYQRTTRGVLELRTTGVPLGLFPNVVYDDKETTLDYGESLLMYSDGLTEAHNSRGEMFDYPRLRQYLEYQPGVLPLHGEELIRFLMEKLAEFTGPNWEQEDDVTLVTLVRSSV